MKAIALAVVLTLVVGGQCATNCHWGPSYWCQSEATAEECGGTQYCKDNVWKKSPVSKPAGIECAVCEIVVDFIEKEVETNKTEAQVKQALLEFCNSTGPLASTCTSFVNDEFDKIWNIIVDGGDAACSALGFCSSVQEVSHPLKKMELECSICKEVAQKVLNLVESNFTKGEIKVEIKKVCPYLAGFAPECRMIIDKFFDEIWNAAVKAMTAEEICQTIKLCSSSRLHLSSFVAKPKVPSIQAGLCDLCKLVVSTIKPLVDANNSKEEVKDALETVCKFLPGNYSNECDGLIKEYFEIMWTVMKAEVDTGDVCSMIKLCNESSSTKLGLQSRVSKEKLKVPQTIQCDICKLVATFLKPYVDSNTTKGEVEAAVEQVCKILPGDLSQECMTLVNTSFDVIWNLLVQEVDSGEICSMLKLCTSSTVLLAKSPQIPMDAACDMCTLITTFLQPYVDSEKTEAEVKAAVQTLCGILPSEFSQTCNDTVNQYFDTIWELFEGEIDNAEICKVIGVCPNSTRTHFKQSVGGEVCDACKLVVKYLRDIVDNNMTETEAKAMVELVCDKAGPLKDECDSMIDNYFPMVWKLLQSYVDDDQICTEIKLCTSASSKLLSLPQSKVQSSKVGGVFCMVCELVMKEVTSMLDTNTTKQAIEDALDKVCSVLPSSFSEDCTHFVDKYAPEIIELILSGTAGKAVCTALGLCVLQDVLQEKQLVTVGGAGECFLCTTAVELAKKLIASKSATTKVDEIVENVCKLVPVGLRSECTDFIETYGPQLIQLLEKEIDANEICTELNLCSKTSLLA